ncbi:uncharacterized protein LOC131595698 [Vicia villosa]|uniref:uncharacterized protein LOC131595698 n=1 Tax=Vicia villosa TaxID=3911 RepID=UPI00273AB96E|nr:uncharacterized protein LOC131595698 [Vicia villosa]
MKVKLIRERMKASQTRKQSYHDKRIKDLEFQISDRVGNVAYSVALPPNLSNLRDVFHVSQPRKYIFDSSHVIHMDDVQVRDNITVETMPVRIEDHENQTLRGKEIVLVKVEWSGAARESMTWELEGKMRKSYPELFGSGKFSRKKIL